MRKRLSKLLPLFWLATTVACGYLSPPTAPITQGTTELPTSNPAPGLPVMNRPILKIPISVYILDDLSEALSSNRTAEELEEVYGRVNEIWAPAGIEFELQGIHRVELPSSLLEDISNGEFNSFFQTIETQNIFPDPGLINGFYTRSIGGPNGINPGGYRIFLVMDEPSVHDERVTSHEIGHILGLHHTLTEQDRLIYPGTNGIRLTEEEIIVTRYVTEGILDRVR